MKRTYSRKFGSVIADRLTGAWRDSTNKNYQRCWREFQRFLETRLDQTLDTRLVLEFLEHLFSFKKLSPKTVLGYRAALAAPLKEEFDIAVSDTQFSLLSRSQFIERPPKRRLIPKWNLDPVLELLRAEVFTGQSLPLQSVLDKTLFLVALATGNRASELSALLRSGLHWRADGSVIIPVKPKFLFKNQRANRAPPNVRLVPLPEDPVLCPVENLKLYLEASKHQLGEALFLHPATGRLLQRPSMALSLARVVDRACPGTLPKFHEIRKQAASLAWTRGIAPADIVGAAFWTSSRIFLRHYLNPEVSSNRGCVALGFPFTGVQRGTSP